MKHLVSLLFLFVVFALFTSCTTGEPKVLEINGVTRVYTPQKVFGITYYTRVEEMKTKKQQLDDLEVEKAKEEQEQDLKTEARQEAATFWFGAFCFGAAAACVILGYLCSGWKFWGGLAGILGMLGVASWSFEHLIPHLKWVAYSVAIAVVLYTMWLLRDFSLKKWLSNRKRKA